jgi:hypothetical protein
MYNKQANIPSSLSPSCGKVLFHPVEGVDLSKASYTHAEVPSPPTILYCSSSSSLSSSFSQSQSLVYANRSASMEQESMAQGGVRADSLKVEKQGKQGKQKE